MTNKLTTKTFLEKLKLKRTDKAEYYNYDKVIYTNSHSKIEIICPIHGSFDQLAYCHLQDQNCKLCNLRYIPSKEGFITKSKEVHHNKFDYSKVIYINSHTKVEIICPIHGSFWQTPKCHISGQSCPNCANNKKSDTIEFIKKCIIKHGNKYDYSEVIYINSKIKVKIICKEHGPFYQTPNAHLKGAGCKKCGINKNIMKNTKSKENFINLSNIKHNKKYNYDKVIYINRRTKIIITCPIHGDFIQFPYSHLLGRGCPKCKNAKTSIRNKKMGRDLSFELLKEIASKYKTRGEFQQKDPSAYSTARRAGILPEICKHMAVISFSIPQLILQDIMDYFLSSKSLYNSRKIIHPYEIDIYYPEFNLAMEYHGKGWHNENTKHNGANRDIIKKNIFEERKINIIYIIENNRKYEEDIKNQIIQNLDKINEICNKNITKENILNYKIGDIYCKIYNKKDLFNIAKKYTSYIEFHKNEPSVYEKLRKMNLLYDATIHMNNKPKHHTINDILETIKKYTYLGDLINNDKGTYLHIHRNNLRHLISHLKRKNAKKHNL